MNKQAQLNDNSLQSFYFVGEEQHTLHGITTAQHELWLSETMSQTQPFNFWGYGVIDGPLNVELLRQAVEITINDIPALQARFVEKEGELYQYHAKQTAEPLYFYDFSSSHNPLDTAIAWMRDDADRAVSVLAHDLYHFAVLNLAPEKCIFYRRLHHMLIDGRGGEEFSRRIVLTYNALASQQPIPEFESCGFTQLYENDKKYRGSARLGKDSQFWKQYTASSVHTLTRKEKHVPYSEMNISKYVLDKADLDQIDQCAAQIGVHRAHLLTTAVAACFYSVTGHTELNFSLPVAGTRERSGIGMTANVVPLILRLTPDDTLEHLARQVTAEMGKTVRRQLYRGEDIRRDRNAADVSWFGPAINIVAFDNGDSFWQCKTRWHYGGNISVSDMQILFFEDRQAQELDVMFVDAPHIHSLAQLDNLQRRFQFILQSLCHKPDSQLEDVVRLAAKADEADLQDNFYVSRLQPAAGGVLCWDQSAQVLERLSYAIGHPSQACPVKLALKDGVLGIDTVDVCEGQTTALPGTILHIDDQGWDIATAQGIVRIGGWFNASGKVQSGKQLARQYKLEPGQRLPVLSEEQASRLTALFDEGKGFASFWQARLEQPIPSAFPARQIAPSETNWQATAWQFVGKTDLPTFLSAVAVYLARMGDQTDFQIGWLQRQVDSLLADAVLPVHVSLDMTQHFSATQQLLKTECDRVLAHLPFHPELHALLSPTVWWPLTIELISDISAATDCPIDAGALLQIDKAGNRFRWLYDEAVLGTEQVDRLSTHLLFVLEQARNEPDTPVSELCLLNANERHYLLEEMNVTAADFPPVSYVHAMFEEQADKTPDAIALRYGDAEFSYAEINTRANRLAHELLVYGVGAETRVAICATRSPELIVAMLAVLKAGGAYVPLDPSYPGERLEYILNDCRPVLLLADAVGRSALSVHPVPVLDLEATLPATISSENLAIQVQPNQLVYVVYTSGSTGKPKGVMVEHGQLLNLIYWHAEATELKAGERTTCMAGLGFDACVWEIWPSLSLGATVLIPPREVSGDSDALLRWWGNSDAQISFMVTPLAEVALAAGHLPVALRTLLIGGDSIRRWPLNIPHGLTLLNNYGPTETTVVATSGNPHTGAVVPSIGRPIANTRAYLLDESGQPVPLGAIGELYIGGEQVARGYLNQPELTAERFLDDPFKPGGRMYRTGDRARYLPDGSLEYLGRNDHQVKIRGFRIEPGEIEAQLVSHPFVCDAVVDALSDSTGEKRLVAWLVPAEESGWGELNTELSAFLAGRLPDYMIPTVFVSLKALPLSPNGKLDRRALPAPDLTETGRMIYVAPEGETELLLARIWQDLLGVERVGRDDNFFELGGHSLLVVKLLAQLRKVGLATDLQALFSAPTLSVLAQTLVPQADVAVPENRIRVGSETITPDMLPLADLAQEEITAITDSVQGGVVNVQDIYALSPLQEGIYFHHQLAEKGDPYLLSATLQFDSRSRLDNWLAAMQQVITRHDILRTAFVATGTASPVQVVWRQANFNATELVLDPAEGQISQQLASRYDPRHTRLDLTQAPLLHVVIAQEQDGSWCALQQWHHLIGDHTTLALMVEEVCEIMAGNEAALKPAQPFRNAVAQARLGVSDSEHETFFRRMLADMSEPVLPFGLSNVHGDGLQTNEASLTLPADLNRALRVHAKQLGVSLASLCHLAWGQVLARTSGQDSVVFGTVLLGRMQSGEGAESALGLFINTLPLRLEMDSRSTENAVRQTHQSLSALLAHEHAPLALAQRCSGLPAGTPLFSALLNYRHNEGDNLPLPEGVSLISAEERTNYPFVLSVDDGLDMLSITAQVIAPIEAERVCGYMQQALSALTNALAYTPDLPVCELPIVPDNEYAMLVNGWNSTARGYPQSECLQTLFEAQVARTPDAVALVFDDQVCEDQACDDQTLSYTQLNEKANQLAHTLIALGVGPDSRIAVCAERSLAMVIGLLGILKAGGAYVPLDPAYPGERLQYILQDADPVLLLTDEAGRNALGKHAIPEMSLNGNQPSGVSCENPVPQSQPDNLAYVIYTSGSTGKPKGTMNEHRGIVNRLIWMQEAYGLTAEDTVLQKTPFGFDVSVWEFFWPLMYGARLVMARPEGHKDPDYLSRTIARYGVTTLHFVPSMLQSFLAYSGAAERCQPVARVICSGEALPASLVKACYRQLPHAQLHNLYGPTEAAVDVTAWHCSRETNLVTVPIGRPVANTRIYLLDKYGQPVPLGAVGEMYIGGIQVARGYLNRPELTAERFLSDPFNAEHGGRMYRTGDLARYLPDGNIEYLGRNDQQVKIRGFRIECGEIEAVLQTHPQVLDAVVDARSDRHGDKHLIAWFVSGEGCEPDGAGLRDYLTSLLPNYMVPVAFMPIDTIPLSPNGKLDRRALPDPQAHSQSRADYMPPENETEQRLATLWEALLEVERVGRDDNFFALGGHSLLAVRLANRMQQLGQPLALSALFANPVLHQLARQLTTDNTEGLPSIEPVVRGERLPLSFAQQRLWFLTQLDGMSEIYHMPLAVRLRGSLDIPSWQRSLDTIYARHEALRTVFSSQDGLPCAQILPAAELPLTVHDLRQLSYSDKAEAQALQIAASEASRPFDLMNGPLLRVSLIRLSDDEQIFTFTCHHLVSDGWSNGILLRELAALYQAFTQGEQNPLRPLSVQYADYASWQRQWLTPERLSSQADYWQQQLSDAPVLLTLPTDRPRPVVQSFAGDQVVIRLEAELAQALRQFSQRNGATLFMTVLAAWGIVLSRLSGQQDVVIGTPDANRRQLDTEPMMGFFVSTLALRLDLSGDIEWPALLQQVRETLLLGQENGDLPFEQVVEQVNPPRQRAYTPLFQVMLTWQENTAHNIRLPGLDAEPLAPGYAAAKYDLTLDLTDHGQEVAGALYFATALFDRATAERYVAYLHQVLIAIAKDVSEPVNRINLLPEAERQWLLDGSNQSENQITEQRCLHHRFEAMAAKTPDAIALVSGDQQLSYQSLNQQANQLAHELIARGVGPDTLVALCTERGIGTVVAILAILKAGGAYVPLDPAYSGERLQYIVQDAAPVLLLADEAGRSALGEQAIPLLSLDKPLAGDSRDPQVAGLSPANLAYVIYTSGSTGQPKGVMVEHRQVDRLFTATDADFGFNAEDVWCLFHSFAFDFSVWEIWGALRHGGRLVVVPQTTARSAKDFYRLVCQSGVTVLNQTPSAFKAFIQAQDDTPHQLRYIVFGGEMLNPVDLTPWYDRHSADAPLLVNMYGITETTVHVTYRAMSPSDIHASGSPIGHRLSDLRLYLLDPHGQPVPYGAVGELYVGGDGVARGYLNRPALNAERFLDDPFHDGGRLYRSGDLARYLPNGELEYLGRNDQQVKIRGFRIECGEVEAALLAHQNVTNVAVDAWQAADGDKRLVAWVVPKGQTDRETLAVQWRQFLSNRLPDYMVPASFVCLDEMPLTTNGKLDKRALPAPEKQTGIREVYEPPKGEKEGLLAALWASLLGVESVGRNDNFFDLGGHSLLAVQLANRIEQAGWTLSLPSLFSTPVLHALAEELQGEGDIRQRPVTPVSRQEPVPLSFAQQRLWFLSQIEGTSETYHIPVALTLTGLIDKAAFSQSLDALYSRHESLRSTVATQGDQPQVRFLPEQAMPLSWHDLRAEPEANARRQALVQARREMTAPFDLSEGPLVRAHVWQITDNHTLFVLVCHHIVSDGWSTKILLKELGELYQAFSHNRENPLSPLRLQYADYAHWQREHLSQDKLDRQAQFWRNSLADAPTQLTLPTDKPRPPVQSFAGAEVPLEIDEALTQSLRHLSKQHGTSLFMTVLAAWGIVLSRLSGQQQVVIGMPDANRGRLEVEPIVGFFVSTLALHIDLREDPSLDTLLTRVRQAVLAARENSDLPFEQVVEALNPPRQLDRTPLFQVMLSWQDNTVRDISLPGLEVAEAGLGYDIAKFDLTLALEESGEQITGMLNFATALFEAETVHRFSDYLLAVLTAMAADVSQPVSQVDILPDSERKLLLHSLNQTERVYPGSASVHQLIEEQASRSPQAVALVCGDEVLSYGQLDNRANRLAHGLIARGVGIETRVAVCAVRKPDMIVALLAVLKAGGAYVPLDPDYPAERLHYILKDSAPVLLLADSAGRKSLGDVQVPVLALDEPLATPLSVGAPETMVRPEHLAYVVYTSGSTGHPKGVMVEHAQLMNLIGWHAEATGLQAREKSTCMAGLGFDACVWEIWPALSLGGTLLLPPLQVKGDSDALLRWWQNSGAQVSFMVTPLAEVALANEMVPQSLRKLLIGGDSVRRWPLNVPPGLTVVNNYGPTETTVVATSMPLDLNAPAPSIGRPVSNTRVYLLDDYGNPVPKGAVGELYIGGVQVARGYLNQPALTAERFLDDPFHPPGRMYRTGDLARYLADGSLEFLGRNDHQVKIRGFRIELGEIETQLGAHPTLKDVVIDAPGGTSGDKRLIAWVVPEDSVEANSEWSVFTDQLRLFLSTRMPEYMIPSDFVRMKALPMSPNGKLDRRSLPLPEAEAGRAYMAPQGETEILLAKIWATILEREYIGRNDNFFELGGHSLLVVKLMAELRRYGLAADVKTLFSAPTLASLASALGSQQEVRIPENRITVDTTSIIPELVPLADLNQQDIDQVVATVPGGVGNVQDIYGLSPLQEGIYFHHLLNEQGDTYLLSALLRFDNRQRLDNWLSAMQQVVDRHDILRSAFISHGLSESVQVVWRHATLPVSEVALNPADGPVAEQLLARFDSRCSRLDLTKAPLLNMVVSQDEDGRWLMLQQWHHLIGDHSTSALIESEIATILAGRASELAVAPPYRNVIAQSRLGKSQAQHEVFFRQLLADIEEPVLPFGLSDVRGDGARVVTSHLSVPGDLNRALREQARKLGVSLASLCHLAWAQVLSRVTGRDTVVFGTVLLGRMQAGEGAEQAMGLFINTLPLRLDINDKDVVSAVQQAHQNVSGLLEHEHAPLALAQRCSGLPAGTPLFSALLNYRHNKGDELILPAGIELLSAEERTNYPFVMSVEDGGDSLGLTAQISQPVEAARVCEYMLQALTSLSHALDTTPDMPVNTLDIVTDAEYRLQLETWNQTTMAYPADCCVHTVFEQQVRANPDAIAVTDGLRSVSYAELNIQANQLSHVLIERGLQAGDPVAVRLGRSLDLVVAQLAVLKAGAVYVPIDPKLPESRQAWIISDCGACIVITEQPGDDALSYVLADERSQRTDNPERLRSSTATAYIMYTSGSTGQPKGVMTPHQGISRLVINNGYAGFDETDIIAFAANPAFDASTMEVWSALLNGGQLVVISPQTVLDAKAFAEVLQRQQITALFLTTALFNQYVHTLGSTLSQLRYLICGGEKEDPAAFAKLLQYQRPVKLIHAYGPTETTTFATTAHIEHFDGHDRLPIGKPVGNTRAYVLDARGRVVPRGAVGELYIGGVGVALGYLNRPEMSAERFLPDPFNAGANMYRTGDLVRYLPDGSLEYQGRNDRQVKIRGFRIEMGEIEQYLRAHDAVRDVVVDVNYLGDGQQLVAWLTLDDGASAPETPAMRKYLAESLPAYMLPSAYIWLECLPLTPNGKVDRRALPAPQGQAFTDAGYVPPQGDTEVMLAQLWRDLLGMEQVGRYDHFFELGGHSLLAVRQVSMAQSLGLSFPVQAIFDHPVLADLAEQLDNQFGERRPLSALPARRSGIRPPLFFLPTGFGDHSYVYEIAKVINPDHPVYAVPWPDMAQPLPETMDGMAAASIALIRKIQPCGPYHLFGYSSGGILAYQIALQLQREGEEVALLGLFDTMRPQQAMSSVTALFLSWFEVEHVELDLALLAQLRDMPLQAVLRTLKDRGISTQMDDHQAELLLWNQRYHYATLVGATTLSPSELAVHLFKAKEDMPPMRSDDLIRYWEAIKPQDFNRTDNSALGWEHHLPAHSLIVKKVDGDHVTMMADAENRRRLGECIDAVLQEISADTLVNRSMDTENTR
ncbi:amino acid adenylation domain-containing protein [Photobacterium sp. CAU 1568]|uniref:Methionyl-tRNA formyltransferase n=1 Tax=Photobacterium arenosum TaxID=2774143 RepID=A0ABR9BPM1_9GAMM|nr:non-ribosomal peptide synthetase [Photobacterium arenosum]MBD8514514.1 amino acid adenylation domain-containing protein [Photobacterium arenosum]